MTASVFKLIQLDLNQMIDALRTDSEEKEHLFVDEKQNETSSECTDNITES
jgi:hypothetical protein